MRILISKFRIKVWFPSRTKYFKKFVFSHSIRLKGIKSFSPKLKQLVKRKMLTLKTLNSFLWYCLNMKHPFCLSSEEEKMSGESSTKFECKNCRHLSLKVFGPLDNVGEIYMESIFRKFSKEQNYKRFNMTAPDFRENEICLQHF